MCKRWARIENDYNFNLSLRLLCANSHVFLDLAVAAPLQGLPSYCLRAAVIPFSAPAIFDMVLSSYVLPVGPWDGPATRDARPGT